jgi:P4 family phage/plasmid primase-like protien
MKSFVEKLKINNMMNVSLEDFIHLNSINDVHHVTHTTMIQPQKRFSFKREHQNSFITLYCEQIFEHDNKQLGITEIPLGKIPIIVDIDLSIPLVNLKDRTKLYTIDHIKRVVNIFQTVLQDIGVNIHNDMLTAFVLEKPGYTFKSNFKNGFHLQFPNFIIEKHVYQRILYPLILEELKKQDVFSDIFKYDADELSYSYDDIYDTACFRNPWLMYGSRKAIGSDTYVLTGIIQMDGEFIQEQSRVDEYIKENVVTYWPEGKILNYVKPIKYYLPFILSVHVIYKEPVELREQILYTNPFKEKGFNNEPTRNSKKIKQDIEVLRELMPLISVNRAEIYGEWVQMGWLIYNISGGTAEGYNIWIEFSRRSDKFDEDHCEKLWINSIDRGLSIGSICYYVQQDSPKEYLLWRKNRIIEHANLKQELYRCDSHHDIAKILYDLYRSKYVCASLKYKLWFEFVGNRWKQIEGGVTLKKKITSDIEEILVTIELSLKENDHPEDPDPDNPPMTQQEKKEFQDKKEQHAKDTQKMIRRIRSNIKSAPYKANVMSEASEMFYDEYFLQKLNANPYVIGFKNGVVDLKNNIVREGCPDDYISLQMNIACKEFKESDAEIQNVYTFLEQIFPDCTVRQFFLDNYCEIFVGGNPNKYVCFWSGEGDNGKSVTEALFEHMLGEYAIKLPTALLTGKRTASSSACPELDRAGNGVRWALLQEPDQHEVINIGILKELSGNDTIYVRGLFKEGREIKPLFKLVFVCNEPPKIPYSDKATWNRIRVIPFESFFTDDAPEDYREQLRRKVFKKDKKFEDKLPNMIEAFAWVLLNHRRKRIEQGIHQVLFEPDKVMSATLSYKARNDVYLQFVEECIEEGNDTDFITTNILYNVFKDWFKTSVTNIQLPSKSDVTLAMSKIWNCPAEKNKWKNKSIKRPDDEDLEL